MSPDSTSPRNRPEHQQRAKPSGSSADALQPPTEICVSVLPSTHQSGPRPPGTTHPDPWTKHFHPRRRTLALPGRPSEATRAETTIATAAAAMNAAFDLWVTRREKVMDPLYRPGDLRRAQYGGLANSVAGQRQS